MVAKKALEGSVSERSRKAYSEPQLRRLEPSAKLAELFTGRVPATLIPGGADRDTQDSRRAARKK